MGAVILTLQVPRGDRGIPVVTTANADLLSCFRQVVLAEAQQKVEIAEDELEALLARLELDRLQRALAALIPEDIASGRT
jgi:hypothetical protein